MNAHLLLLIAGLACLAGDFRGTMVSGFEVATGGAAAALAVGVAAVVGLKIAALAAYALTRGRGRGRGRGGRRYGRRRGRRSAELEEESYFEMVEQMDSMGCGLKVVCELEARQLEDLAADEKLILSLFGSSPSAPSYVQLTDSAKGKYSLAAYIGAERKDAKRCSQMFPKCAFSSEQLMGALRQVQPQ